MKVGRAWLKGGAALLMTSGLIVAGCSQSGTTAPMNTDNKQADVRKDISATIYDRGSVPAAEGSIENNRWTKWLNDKGPANVKFVAVPRFESQQKLNVLFASASAPDLIFEYAPHIKNPLIDQKLLMPLDEMIEKHSTTYKQMLQQYPALKKVGMKSDGKIYEFARLSEVYPIHALLIREDWLKKLNLQAPQTTEELYKVAKAFAENDPDGNGKKDTHGIAISLQSGQVVDQIFQATRWVVKDGTVTRNWDNFTAVTDFKKRLFDEGIVDKDFLNDKNGAKAKQDFVNGKVGIYPLQINWVSFAQNELTSLKKNVPDAIVTPIAYPKSPAGQFNPAYANPVQATAVVNASTKHPDAVMKFVDFLVKHETASTLKNGIEGEHWKQGTNGCPEPISAEKRKTEVAWNTDTQMLSSPVLDMKCGKLEMSFNLSEPVQKEGFEMYKKAMQIYSDPNKPYVEITHPEHMPQLPKDIEAISGPLVKPIDDMFVKGILGGKAYTAEQATKDAKEVWEKGNGKKIEEWFRQWYEKDSKNAFLAKDMYEILKQQTSQK
ncbi:extracellular solute-binding protein [Paenibacillus sp. V4I7]|uniref:extracellular solute-binding protein n=1 Tax=Paenibacillus sp. V4I7 TaxID=3042307 RepID=UPI002785410F|nr:extracellular solute-binding protein [Paenibacillus sp. V4I7]MDQ0899175.1 putative aldouronate transport system substrate-binding protein [Paenibacillus sp. V4I7]